MGIHPRTHSRVSPPERGVRANNWGTPRGVPWGNPSGGSPWGIPGGGVHGDPPWGTPSGDLRIFSLRSGRRIIRACTTSLNGLPPYAHRQTLGCLTVDTRQTKNTFRATRRKRSVRLIYVVPKKDLTTRSTLGSSSNRNEAKSFSALSWSPSRTQDRNDDCLRP